MNYSEEEAHEWSTKEVCLSGDERRGAAGDRAGHFSVAVGERDGGRSDAGADVGRGCGDDAQMQDVLRFGEGTAGGHGRT